MKTAGTFDAELMLINSTANVTATVNGAAVDFNGPDTSELNIRVIVPQASGTNPKLTIAYQESDDGTTNWVTVYTFPQIAAAGEYNHKCRAGKRYRRAVATVAGTSPNFGFLMVGASTGGVLY